MRAAARPPSLLCVRRNVPTGRPVHPLGAYCLQEVEHYKAHLQMQVSDTAVSQDLVLIFLYYDCLEGPMRNIYRDQVT